MLYAFIFLLFIIISLIFLEEYLGDYKKYVYWGLCIILIIFSAFRPIGIDPDARDYELMFLSNEENPTFVIDPSYMFLAKIFRLFTDDVHFLFLFYAIIGIGIKFYALRKLSPFFFLPIIIYFGNYYILHDYIQMRAAIASAALLLAIKPISEGKKKTALGYFLIATIFHSSTLALLPILFFNNTNSKLFKC